MIFRTARAAAAGPAGLPRTLRRPSEAGSIGFTRDDVRAAAGKTIKRHRETGTTSTEPAKRGVVETHRAPTTSVFDDHHQSPGRPMFSKRIGRHGEWNSARGARCSTRQAAPQGSWIVPRRKIHLARKRNAFDSKPDCRNGVIKHMMWSHHPLSSRALPPKSRAGSSPAAFSFFDIGPPACRETGGAPEGIEPLSPLDGRYLGHGRPPRAARFPRRDNSTTRTAPLLRTSRRWPPHGPIANLCGRDSR